jgi:small GTP-binding protein
MTEQKNVINVAIVGTVSAGKSTFCNSLFTAQFSSMKIKRTTMTPQVYIETNQEVKDIEQFMKDIKEKNDTINNNIIKKTEANEELTLADIPETKYLVPRVYDLLDLPENVFLNIYDVPGINDFRTNELYYSYLEENFYKFDIVILVVDINSAFNTSDENVLLTNILNYCKSNKEKYGVENKMIVLANKCDDMQFSKNGNPYINDEEISELYEQINHTVKQKRDELYSELEYKILPLSSRDSFIYRMYARDSNVVLDPKLTNVFGENEFGKKRWACMTPQQKQDKIKELMKEMDMNTTLKLTGYVNFKDVFNTFLNDANQYNYLCNHIKYDLTHLEAKEISLDIKPQILEYYNHLENIINLNVMYVKDKSDFVTDSLARYLDKYKSTIVNQYIDKVNDDNLETVEKLQTLLTDYHSIISVNTLDSFNTEITNSLNKYYQSQISNHSKPFTRLFTQLGKLLSNGFKITKDLVLQLFKHTDLKTKTGEEIINYIEDLISKGLVEESQRAEIATKQLMRIYNSIYQKENVGYITKDLLGYYSYLADKFWSDLSVSNHVSYVILNKFRYMAKRNMISEIYTFNNDCFENDEVFEGGYCNKNEKYLVLEKYIVDSFNKMYS